MLCAMLGHGWSRHGERLRQLRQHIHGSHGGMHGLLGDQGQTVVGNRTLGANSQMQALRQQLGSSRWRMGVRASLAYVAVA